MHARVAGHGQSEAGAVSNDPGPMVADRSEPEAETRHEITSSLADRAEVAMLAALQAGHVHLVEMPVTHRFAEGLYIRTIFIPAGTVLTSREHLHQHPFVISQGDISVTSEKEGAVRYTAPHVGITEPGTRRVLAAHADTTWTTVHLNPTNETDPDKIVLEITGHDNPLVDPSCPLLRAWSKDHSTDAALEQATAPTITTAES
ncbi:hypothetical protein [Luteolibacter sp. Populi]|uniref:hypothetical protein n=1 Tax=Luteolibacter sp. Populi TaxID=3230487 RepID=UPI00346787A5